MSDIQGQEAPAEDREVPQENKLELPHCPSSLAIKTSLVQDQMKIIWTIDEFGMIPKHADILKMYDTSFVVGEKKNIPCQWDIGLGLTQAPVENPKVTEQWLTLCYGMVSAPPGTSTVFFKLAIQVEDAAGIIYYGGTRRDWTKLGNLYMSKLVPRPKLWPSNKVLEIHLDLTVVVKRVMRTFYPCVEIKQEPLESGTDNVS